MNGSVLKIVAVSSILVLCCSYLSICLYWMGRYDAESFNCKDMSYALAPVFQNLGFDTKVIYGSNDRSAHCWLSLNGVFFDATSLCFSSEDDYRIDFVDGPPWGYWDELEREC